MRHFLIIIISFYFASCSTKVENKLIFGETKTPSRSISPLITSWGALSDTALNEKVSEFWKLQNNFPMVEIDLLDSNYLNVTFICKESSRNKEIEFDIFGNYEDINLGDKKLFKLRNTDFYYRTYYMPSDICFAYRYISLDTVTKERVMFSDPLNNSRIPTGELKPYSWSVFDLRKDEKVWYEKKYNNAGSKIDTLKYSDKIVNKERNIYVYLPPNYDEKRKESYPTIYLFDAFIYLNRVELPNVLDNLITEGKIEPMIAVLFGTFKSTRDIILPLNFDFKDEFVSDVLTLIRSKYNTSLKPEDNIIGGMSYGGLAAMFIASYNPDIFGKVLSQSGSFWRDTIITEPFINWHRTDWLINKIQTTEKKDIKIYLDWGQQESHVMVQGANRKLVRIIDKLGYDYKYIEFSGWHDWSNSRKTFPVGLKYLLSDE